MNKKFITETKKNIYRPEIDGLRAIAVIAVIINHFNKEILPSGYLGVDIFFVISGYVITSSLLNKKSENFSKFITNFYERRFKRLIPALIPFTIFTGILICFFNSEPAISLKTGITSLFGLSNIYLFSISTNYFADSTQLNAFAHTWSLNLEKQFYLFYPILIWLTGFAFKNKNRTKTLFLANFILIFISLGAYIYVYQINESAAYFLTPYRLWEMAAGCITFLLFEKKRTFRTKSSSFLKNFLEKKFFKAKTYYLFFFIFIIFFLPESLSLEATILIVFLTSLLIYALSKQDKLFTLLTNKFIIHIGKISYSLYLWHWTVLCISRLTIGINLVTAPLQILLIYFFAFTSHKWVETPFRNKQWSLRRLNTIFKGSIALFSTSFFLFFLLKPLNGILYAGDYKYDVLVSRSRIYKKNKINITGTDQSFEYNGLNCHFPERTNYDQIMNFNKCSIKKENSRKIYFVGNSYTDHLRETHYLISNQQKISINGISISGCLFPQNQFQKECGDFQKSQENIILNNIKKGDIVVISNNFPIEKSQRNYDLLSIHFQNIELFSRKIENKKGKVVLFGPLPIFKVRNISLCKNNWFQPIQNKECYISKNEFLNKRNFIYKLLKNLPKEISIYYPSEVLCPNGKCSMMDSENRPLFIDGSHLTDFANKEYIFKDFMSFMKKEKII